MATMKKPSTEDINDKHRAKLGGKFEAMGVTEEELLAIEKKACEEELARLREEGKAYKEKSSSSSAAGGETVVVEDNGENTKTPTLAKKA